MIFPTRLYSTLKKYIISKKFKLIIKVVFPIIIVITIMSSIELNDMKSLFLTISIPFFFCTFLIATMDQVVMGLKWNILLKVFQVKVPFYIPIVAYLRGKVFQLYIPSIFGIDTYKSLYIKKHSTSIIPVISSIFVERFVGMLSSLALISLLFHFASKNLNVELSSIFSYGGFFIFVSICLVLYFFIEKTSSIIKILFSLILPSKVKGYINNFLVTLTKIEGNKHNIFSYFTISIFEKLFYGTCIYFAAKSVGLNEISYLYIISASPLLALLERIPISISTIGIREGLFVALFYPCGVDTTTAIAVALTMRCAEICLILLSFIFWGFNIKSKTSNQDIEGVEKEIKAYEFNI